MAGISVEHRRRHAREEGEKRRRRRGGEPSDERGRPHDGVACERRGCEAREGAGDVGEVEQLVGQGQVVSDEGEDVGGKQANKAWS